MQKHNPQTTSQKLDEISKRIQDIRSPGYAEGWNDGLECAASFCDTIEHKSVSPSFCAEGIRECLRKR